VERLTLEDERALLGFLRDVYGIRDPSSFVAHLLSGLASLVPNQLTAYCEMRPKEATSQNWTKPQDALTPAQYCIWHQFMHEHPVLTHSARTGDCRARKISDFYSMDRFHRLGLYNESYKPVDIEDVLCFNLRAQEPLVVGIALHRHRRNYTERDRLLLNLALPHLVQAWVNARKVNRLERELKALRQTLDSLHRGVVVLGRDGRVRVMTPQARQYVSEYFGAENALTYRLPDGLARWVREEDEALARSYLPAARRPLVIEHEGRRLTVRLLSDSDRDLLLLEEHAEVQPGTLQRLGLTKREAEVLAWVEKGKTNAEIASILGISERTVEKHLEHIYTKLGVESRTAAAIRAFEAAEEPEPRILLA